MTYTERFLSSLIALISILRRPIFAGREATWWNMFFLSQCTRKFAVEVQNLKDAVA